MVTTKVSERGAALNKVRWSADGRRLLVGDVEGHTYVYEIGEVRLCQRKHGYRLEDIAKESHSLR